MCFDREAWEKGSQGVQPETVKGLRTTASVLADVQGDLWEADPRAKRTILVEARPHLANLRSQLSQVRVQSRCPQVLPSQITKEEELLSWAAGFAWHPES